MMKQRVFICGERRLRRTLTVVLNDLKCPKDPRKLKKWVTLRVELNERLYGVPRRSKFLLFLRMSMWRVVISI